MRKKVHTDAYAWKFVAYMKNWCACGTLRTLFVKFYYSLIVQFLLGVVRQTRAYSKFFEITICQYFEKGLSFCIDYFHVVRHPCKLQFDHYISSVRCGQGCPGMSKVFRNNERLIFLEIVEFRRVELY